MKKYLAMMVAGLLCACCMGLAACGGSASSSAASGSASTSAASSPSASAASVSTASSATASSATASSSSQASATASSAAAATDVSPELKQAAENLAALADEQVALVEKAKAEGGYDAVKAEWDELNTQVNAATEALQPFANKYADGSLSDADKAYYMKVVVPAASKSASAGLDMLDLITI